MTSSDISKLFEEYKPRFEAFARSYVREAAVAEDLVMESFCQFLQRMNENRIIDESNIPAYILTIVRNQCLDWLARRKRHFAAANELYAEQIRQVDFDIRSLRNLNIEQLFVDEVAEAVRKTLETMPTLTRVIFEKLCYEEKSYKEIVEELQVSPAKVDNERRKALKILRRELSKYLAVALIGDSFIHNLFR